MLVVIKEKLLKSDFFKDSFWALTGNVFVRGSALISAIFLAQILNKNSYGEFNSLRNTLTTLAVFTTFGLGYTSTKFVAESLMHAKGNLHSVIKKVYSLSLLFSSIISILVFLFAQEISHYYYNNVEFYTEIRILSAWIILTALSTAQSGIIAGLKVFKKLAIINIISGILTVTVMPLLAHWHHLKGACIALVLLQCINVFFNHNLIRRQLGNNYNPHGSIAFRSIIAYSLPLTMIEAVYSIGLWANYYLIQNHFNYGEVALYSTAMQWYVLLLFIPMILRNVILSHFSGSETSSEKKLFKNSMVFSFISTFLPLIGIVIGAPAIEYMYGKSFTGLTPVLRIAALIPIFASVMGVCEQFLFSKSKNWFVFSISLMKDGGTFLLFYWFIKFYKVHEAAYFLMLSYLILNIFAFLSYCIFYMYSDVFRTQSNHQNIEDS